MEQGSKKHKDQSKINTCSQETTRHKGQNTKSKMNNRNTGIGWGKGVEVKYSRRVPVSSSAL